jgi:selenocysteine-specific translation elongation factor SelB
VNLSNISLDDVQRGDILSSNPNLSVSMMLDAKTYYAKMIYQRI